MANVMAFLFALVIVVFVIFTSVLLIVYCGAFILNKFKLIRKHLVPTTGSTQEYPESFNDGRPGDFISPPEYDESRNHQVFSLSALYPMPELGESTPQEDLHIPPPYSVDRDAHSPPTYNEVALSIIESESRR